MSATFTVTVNARAMKAAAMCASDQETRYYLKGVFIETSAAGVTLTATDGHRLVAMTHAPATDAPHDATAPAVIVPLHMIDKLKIGKRAPDYLRLTIDATATPAKLTLSFDGLSITGEAVDGTYPAARRVAVAAFNSPDAGKIAHFNPAYVATFGKMAELMTGSKRKAIYIGHNGDNPAIVDFLGEHDAAGVEAFGVLMPCRLKDESGRASRYAGSSVPSWYDPNPVPPPAAADGADGDDRDADAA
jgi:DNA polymerase-3 subunit beta